MKKILVTTLITGALAVSAFAQGTVTFTASSSKGLVKFNDGTTTASLAAGANAQVGSLGTLNIAIYAAPVGTAVGWADANTPSTLGATWKISSDILHTIGPIPGAASHTFSLDTSLGAGGNVQCMLLAWAGNFTDWNTALAAGTALGWAGSAASGGALTWVQATGNPGGTPPSAAVALVSGAGGYAGLTLTSVPEPSTFALAGLGAAALLIFRRRK